MGRLIPALCTTAIVAVWAAPASAQNEEALRAFFEGKRVVVKIDMPGTSDGVDVGADANRAVDFQEYGNRLKSYGAALRAGDSATVTLVKMKKDLIEFQLNGGGFGTFGDDTSTSVHMPLLDKGSREKDLEKLIREETDSRKKREFQAELDSLRDRRERENRRIEVERARAEEFKRERLAERRLRGGSRFNIRYSGSVPQGMRPDDVMAALAAYVDFSPLGSPIGAPTPGFMPSVAEPLPSSAGDPAPRDVGLRKGMLRSDIEQLLGPASQASERREGSMVVLTLVFVTADRRVTAEFVEDVLVRYTIASK